MQRWRQRANIHRSAVKAWGDADGYGRTPRFPAERDVLGSWQCACRVGSSAYRLSFGADPGWKFQIRREDVVPAPSLIGGRVLLARPRLISSRAATQLTGSRSRVLGAPNTASAWKRSSDQAAFRFLGSIFCMQNLDCLLPRFGRIAQPEPNLASPRWLAKFEPWPRSFGWQIPVSSGVER
jgi:hypothetical protein